MTTFCWLWKRSCVLVLGVYTVAELWIWCQQTVFRGQMVHPVPSWLCSFVLLLPFIPKYTKKPQVSSLLNLQVFDSEGDFQFSFGSNGEGNGQFNAPTGVAVDAQDNIIVADWGNSRVQVNFYKISSLFAAFLNGLSSELIELSS